MVLKKNVENTESAEINDPPPSYTSSAILPTYATSSATSYAEDTPQSEPNTLSNEVVEKGSGSISGTYFLRDSLTLETTAGSINVTIIPLDAKRGDQKAAYFTAKASAGSIKVNFPSNKIPDRDYYTTVEAAAGSIQGLFPTGVSSRFHARAGSINIDLLNSSPTTRCDIFTEANAGSTHLKVQAPFSNAPIKDLNGTHRSAAGYIRVEYPRSWEGTIAARTASGRVNVDGQGVRIDKSSDKIIGGYIEATKGDGRGKIEAVDTAGGIHVTVGEK